MIQPLLFNDEIFKDINIDNIIPIYSVSNYGTVINKLSGNQISQQVTADGYARVHLRTIDGNSKGFLVHRLVMMAFHPIDNYDELEVNHIKGKKLDNRDTELEWATSKENVRHAYRTGLNNNIAENHAYALLTNDQVHLICRGLSEGKSFDEIKNELGQVPIKDIDRVIRSIKDRTSWKSISKDYCFMEYPNRRNMFTDDEVVTICKLLESGAGYREILLNLGYEVDKMTTNQLQNMCDIIGDIRNGNRYKNISKDYDIAYDNVIRYDQIFDNDKIHFICKCLEDGMKTPEILNLLGLTKDKISERDYERYRHFISTVKTKKVFTSISDNYNF